MPFTNTAAMTEQNPILKMYEIGFSVGEVKQLIIDTLTPYYKNAHLLQTTDVGLLAIQAINVGQISVDVTSETLLRDVVTMTWKAVSVDAIASFQACAYWESKVLAANVEFWSLLHLETVKDDLPLEEFRVEIFRNIGALIEACLKPILCYTLSLLRIARNKSAACSQIEASKLGVIVNELFDTFGNCELVAPAPWPVRLHQWRNMAQHHSTRVQNGLIVGTYTARNVQTEITLSRVEALSVARRVGELLRIANTARLIFMLDHAEGLSALLPVLASRHETDVLRISSALSTQGFHLEDLIARDEQVSLRIKDQTELPWIGRAAHCSQFVSFVWFIIPKGRITIELASKSGIERVKIWAAGSDLKKVSPQDPELSLAECVHFEKCN